jgi:hypothetical protein
MGVVGRVFTHRMIGVPGGKDVQLPVVLSAALTHSLGRKEFMVDHGVPSTRNTLVKAQD